MVKLRLKRSGKKRAAFYRIVAADSRVQRDGEYIELIGTYDPISEKVRLDNVLALKWLQTGAQPTDSVRTILSKNGVMTEYHNLKLQAKKSQPAKTKKPAAKKSATKKPTAKKASTTKKTLETEQK